MQRGPYDLATGSALSRKCHDLSCADARLFSPVAALRRLSFSANTARDDLIAGITVSLVAIPQSLAYAQLAGLPAYYGLYAALIPTVVGALFGSSRQLSTGPVAMTSLLTAASVAPLAAQGTDMFYAYAVLLALISGVLQILFGLLRMGVLLNFLSHPVLIGFINAAALIIGLSQLPALLGVPARQSDQFLVNVWGVLGDAPTMHEISFVLGAVALVALYAFKRFAPKWPGVLVTVWPRSPASATLLATPTWTAASSAPSRRACPRSPFRKSSGKSSGKRSRRCCRRASSSR